MAAKPSSPSLRLPLNVGLVSAVTGSPAGSTGIPEADKSLTVVVTPETIQAEAMSGAPAMLAVLVGIALDPKVNAQTRVKAVEAYLDRALGKAVSKVDSKNISGSPKEFLEAFTGLANRPQD